jgi:diguanylate cyclase (GGDEF)-like protein
MLNRAPPPARPLSALSLPAMSVIRLPGNKTTTTPEERCEALIDEARRGAAAHVEREARQWRSQAQAAGDTHIASLASHALGTSLLIQSRNAEAVTTLVEVVQAARESGDLNRYVRALVQSASALADMGAYHRALDLLGDAARLADDSVGARARYTLHAVRAHIAYCVRDFGGALANASIAQSHADSDPGGVSRLINRWRVGEMLAGQAFDALRRGETLGEMQLHAASQHLEATVREAAKLKVIRVSAVCQASIALIAVWRGEQAKARRILVAHQQDLAEQAALDIRFRFACIEVTLDMAAGIGDPTRVTALFEAHAAAPLIERSAWARLVGDVARRLRHAEAAARAYERALALQDELATVFGEGLAAVVRLRDDLEQLRKSSEATLADLSAARTGRALLEARVMHLQHEASVDPLTKITNRRGLDLLFNALDHASPNDPLALAFVDIDFFKDINDQLGHAAGDAVLTRVADAMRRVVREQDMVARYAGDEFVLVFPGASLKVAAAVCERLMQTLAATEDDGSGAWMAPTLSIGIALRRPGEAMRELQARADAALYQAKENGRAQAYVDQGDIQG